MHSVSFCHHFANKRFNSKPNVMSHIWRQNVLVNAPISRYCWFSMVTYTERISACGHIEWHYCQCHEHYNNNSICKYDACLNLDGHSDHLATYQQSQLPIIAKNSWYEFCSRNGNQHSNIRLCCWKWDILYTKVHIFIQIKVVLYADFHHFGYNNEP